VTVDTAAGNVPAAPTSGPPVSEYQAATVPGALAAIAVIVAAGAGVALIVRGAQTPGGQPFVYGVVLVLIAFGIARGLVAVAPGEAQVVQLFGRYKGTIRDTGLRWVLPATRRRKVSTRIRSHETGLAKVNDADGNPIELTAVVVWQVDDTAKAVFGVDDVSGFVAVQTETSIRQIATGYPYDDQADGKASLRGAPEEINSRLAAQIGARVAPAGVKVIESRLTRLSYAPEIAHAMLRRQQAGAMVAARQRIVEGAVGMVEAALTRLDADGLVELDPERKAAMVSNMLVVLCSDHPTQPVVNTGTLYQ
jgi:regulator of protease activity HflC (stomatin/prohibitin superfamily)